MNIVFQDKNSQPSLSSTHRHPKHRKRKSPVNPLFSHPLAMLSAVTSVFGGCSTFFVGHLGVTNKSLSLEELSQRSSNLLSFFVATFELCAHPKPTPEQASGLALPTPLQTAFKNCCTASPPFCRGGFIPVAQMTNTPEPVPAKSYMRKSFLELLSDSTPRKHRAASVVTPVCLNAINWAMKAMVLCCFLMMIAKGTAWDQQTMTKKKNKNKNKKQFTYANWQTFSCKCPNCAKWWLTSAFAGIATMKVVDSGNCMCTRWHLDLQQLCTFLVQVVPWATVTK